ENAHSGARRQHDGILDGAPIHERAVPECEEEGLVLDNGPTDAGRELMIVRPIGFGWFPGARLGIDGPVVGPCIRIETGVPDRPHAGSMELIAAGTRHELKLTIAPPHLRIDRSDDDTHFTDQVRAHIGGALQTDAKARGADVVYSVSGDIDGA